MQEIERFSSLVGRIYDAAVDPALWPQVLPAIADWVDGCSVRVGSMNSANNGFSDRYHTHGCDELDLQIQIDRDAQYDPIGMLRAFAAAQVVRTTDLMPCDEYLKSRTFQDWARPQRLIGDEVRRRMQMIAPHVRRAVLISNAIESKTAQAKGFADVLNGLNAGVFFVDEAGRIVHANDRGKDLLATRDVLHAASGNLILREPRCNKAMSKVIAAATAGDMAVGSGATAISLTSRDGQRYVMHALALTSGARGLANVSRGAVAALFLRKEGLETPPEPEVVAKAFGLTASELRVLLAIVAFSGVAAAAEALGIAKTTVKTHLCQLFAKTGTRRQVDLVKLVAGYSSPLM